MGSVPSTNFRSFLLLFPLRIVGWAGGGGGGLLSTEITTHISEKVMHHLVYAKLFLLVVQFSTEIRRPWCIQAETCWLSNHKDSFTPYISKSVES